MLLLLSEEEPRVFPDSVTSRGLVEGTRTDGAVFESGAEPRTRPGALKEDGDDSLPQRLPMEVDWLARIGVGGENVGCDGEKRWPRLARCTSTPVERDAMKVQLHIIRSRTAVYCLLIKYSIQ